MTEKLFDLNSYIHEFDCKVINLYNHNGDLAIETDRTAFFYEGGGQSSDVGMLGNFYVKDTQNISDTILHIVENYEENVEKVSIGDVLHGKIDSKKRFSDMQQHSGEHIFSGIVNKLYGYDNVGFHLGTAAVTLDFNGKLEKEDICKVQNLVNKAIWDNLEIKVFYPTEAELENLSYRSKKEINEALRLVEIPGVDLCACCAPHVKRTGEIGLVNVIDFESHRGGTRVYILCGERAMKDIEEKLSQNKKVGNLLCSKETETFSKVEKLKNSCSLLTYQLSQAKLEILKRDAEKIEAQEKIVVFTDLEDVNAVREYANILSEKAKDFAAVFSKINENCKYVIISKTDYDIGTVAKNLNKSFDGKGGGRGGIVQGSLSKCDDLTSNSTELCQVLGN